MILDDASKTSTTEKGETLEKSVYQLFNSEIESERFWAKKSNCKLFWKKGYNSKDRGKKIVFDISIEIYLPNAENYSMLVLIECKNYKHSVPVDDIEEFFTKVQQVAAANTKAIVVSTASFQSSARNFAKSKGIGLMRFFDSNNFKWELHRSTLSSARFNNINENEIIESALSLQEFKSVAFEMYLQSTRIKTNSLWEFFDDLFQDSEINLFSNEAIKNQQSKNFKPVPFISKESLENISIEILKRINYFDGEVSLLDICKLEKDKGLVVSLDVEPLNQNKDILGRIIFQPLIIEVYKNNNRNRGQDRFTLAHELSHYLLDHGQFMSKETCEDSDFSLHSTSPINGRDISRMEFQANYLASSLLLPRKHTTDIFLKATRYLEIVNKGHGLLYVDDQPCNLLNYERITGLLMKQFGVSRTAARIRLEALGLLHDARQSTLSARESISHLK